ncbi:MAG: OmpA family protein [Meiothermus sp.]|nr:OmpA family protein [Meiothermus sp.]
MNEDDVNPYIALADVGLNLVLVLVFFVAALIVVGRSGWDEVRYKDAQERVRQAVRSGLEAGALPSNTPRNDPPGAQRWVFTNRQLFGADGVQLTPAGRRALVNFARILCKSTEWRRLRVEGHTAPPRPGQPDQWLVSAARAAQVATVFTSSGGVRPYHVGVAGRAGQAPVNKANPSDPANERVEVLVEYVNVTDGDTTNSPCY